MKGLSQSLYLLVLLSIISCTRESTNNQVDYKHTENIVYDRLPADVQNLFPLLARSSIERHVFEQIYHYLIGYNPYSQQFIPELITKIPSPTQTEEGSFAYEFEILKEAAWADGSPVTGKDYLNTLKLIFHPEIDALRYQSIMTGQLMDVIVDEKNPKKFTLLVPEIRLQTLENLTNAIPVLPSYLLDPESVLDDFSLADFLDPEKAQSLVRENSSLVDLAAKINSPEFLQNVQNISGSGPYRLSSWETSQRILVTKKDNWWGDQISKKTHPTLTAYPREINFKPINNANTAVSALKSEEIDVMHRIPEVIFEGLQSDTLTKDRYQFETINGFASYFISINSTSPKLSDAKVRKALAYAVDIDEILDKVYLGYGTRMASPVHPKQSYYNNDLQIIKQNVEKAMNLLLEAGWKDSNNNGIVDKEIEGELLELSLSIQFASGREQTQNAMLLFKDHVKEAGIDLILEALDAKVYLNNWRNKNYELTSVGLTITPTWNPMQSWHTSGANRTGFGNAKTDDLIKRLVETSDQDIRNDLYKELQAIIYEDQAVIFMFTPTVPVVIHNRFETEIFRDFPCYNPRYFKLKEAFKTD